MNPKPFMLYTGRGFHQSRGHIIEEYKLAIMLDQVDWRTNWSIVDLPTGCRIAPGYATLQDAMRGLNLARDMRDRAFTDNEAQSLRKACRLAYQQELEGMRELVSVIFPDAT